MGVDMPEGTKDPAPPVARRTLDQSTILREAARFIDTHGRDRLTMRRLGAELGVEAMALYRYVPGRDQLLDGVVELVMDELYEITMTGRRFESWQSYLEQMAHGVRTAAVRHPRIFPLVATRPSAAPWLRPPLRSLRWVEAFLDQLASFGFDAERSVQVYRSFATFLLGHLLLETATYDERPDPPPAPLEPDDLAEYPRIARLSDELSEAEFAEEFDDALEDLINRVALERL
jgi:AcrR family transcriptional regulator